jgi:hypothetical protein
MSFRSLLTFILSTTILISVVIINFLPAHFLSIILTIVSFITLLQLTIQKSTPPIWQILYVCSIIFFLCMNEIFGAITSISFAGVGYHYSSEAYYKAIIYIVYFVSGTYFAIVFLQEKVTSIPILPKKNITNVKSFKVFFLICFCFMLLDKFSIYSNSKIVGYVDAIHSESSNSLFFILIDILYPVLYCVLAIAYRRKNISSGNFALLTLFFITPYFFTFLSGFRGEFVGKLIALTIIFASITKFPKYYYVIGGSTVLIGVLGMEFIRFDDSLSLLSLPLESYLLAFSYLGNSFDVVPLAIENQAYLFHGWKYFFGGPLSIFSFEPTYSAQGILTKPYLAQHLMSIIDYRRFSGGSTIGSSVVAEIFLFTPYLILPCSYFIIWTSKVLINRSFYSVLFFYISFSYFENMLFMARGGFLKFIDKELFVGVFFIFILVNLPKLSLKLKKKYAQ